MRNIVIFDIETVPNEKAEKPELNESTVKLGNVKDLDKIAAKVATAKADFDKGIIKKMSLDGSLNKVISIAAHRINVHGEVIDSFTAFDSDSDTEIVHEFMTWASNDTLCGWNIKGFDIPVLWKRSILSGTGSISTWKYLDLTKKYGDGCLDLMQVWNNYDMGSMASCCKALGIPVKTEMNGSDVYKYYVDKRYDEIEKYNLEDVNCCLELYRRLYCL